MVDRTTELHSLVTEFWALYEDQLSLNEQLPKMHGFPKTQLAIRTQLGDIDVAIGQVLQQIYDIVKF
jgi:hypothetical protein